MTSRCKTIVLTLLLGALACDGKEPSRQQPLSFFELVHVGHAVDYMGVSGLAEMARLSELVVIGEMRSVQRGGTALGSPTVVARVRVDQVLKGNEDDGELYIEIITGPLATAEKLNRVLPVGAGLWFLQDALAAVSSPADDGRGEHLPSGERLYTAASPQGLLMESDGRLVQPLEPDRVLWLPDIEQYASLSQAGAAVEATLADASF